MVDRGGLSTTHACTSIKEIYRGPEKDSAKPLTNYLTSERRPRIILKMHIQYFNIKASKKLNHSYGEVK